MAASHKTISVLLTISFMVCLGVLVQIG